MNRRVFNVGSCGQCGSGKIYVCQTEKPYRKIKCKICGHRATTLEIVVRPFWVSDCLYELIKIGQFKEYPKKVREALQVVSEFTRLG